MENQNIEKRLEGDSLAGDPLSKPINNDTTNTNHRLIDVWKEHLKRRFPDLVFPAEVCISVICQLMIKDLTNPFALVLVDVPSSGKTITLNLFSNISGISYTTDKFTPASFVSNSANVKKEELAKIDLLPKIKNKVFIIRDLATIFSKRDDDLNETLGILTRVLDGEGLSVDSGVHGQRQYDGEFLFMLLAGSTPIPPRVWKMSGNLGSRLFFVSMNSSDDSEDDLINQLISKDYKNKEKECRKVTESFIQMLWKKYPDKCEWDSSKENLEILRIIARCAKLLARLRGVINVWKDQSIGNDYEHTIPTIEKPKRVNRLLYNLCRGHALACDRDFINEEDLRIAIEVTFDSAQLTRTKLFKAILESENGYLITSEVEEVLNCSKPTAIKEMKTLELLKVCKVTENLETEGNPKEDIKYLKITLLKDFEWFRTKECFKLRNLKLNESDTVQDS